MATLNGGRGWASDSCAASVHRLDIQFGGFLPITSAGRTYAEQAEAYRKYKNGGPLALPPGTSVHESGNAIDWGSGAWGWLGLNAGLGWRGVTINRHGHRRTVSSETWHTEYAINEDNFRGQGGGDQTTKDRQGWLNLARGEKLDVDGNAGPATQAAYKRYQEFLRAYGYTGAVDGDWGPGTQAAHQKYWDEYNSPKSAYDQFGGAPWIKAIQNKLNRLNYGPLDEDGQDGPKTQAAVKRFQSDNDLTADGVAGPITNNKMDDKLTPRVVGRNATSRPTVDVQNALIGRGYSLGSTGADGDYGANTTAAVMAFQNDNNLTADGVYGPMSDAKLFPATPVPEQPATQWPTNGRNATTRPTAEIQKLVGADPDGSYGPNTSQKVAQWQDKNDLDADGIWGPASDLKGFPGIPLPNAPAAPDADPLYGKKIPLYSGAIWADVSPNKSVREGKVQAFIVHHIAAAGTTNESNRKRFMSSNDRSVSPNWYVQADGGISEIVPPDDYRAWTGGAIDHQAVTVETQNTSGAPQWGISAESHEAIANLVAWAAHRYEFPIQRGAAELRDGKNVITVPGVMGHSDTPAGKQTGTLCPGPSMDLNRIINRAKQIYQEKYVETTPPVDPTAPGNGTTKAEIMELLEQIARKVDTL